MELYLFAVLFFGFTMYAANQVQSGLWQPVVARVLWYLAIGLIFLLAFFPLQLVLLNANLEALPPELRETVAVISPTTALLALVFAVCMGAVGLLTANSELFRMRLMRLTGISSRYDPQSVVHTTALILMVLVMTGVVVLFVATGGLSGLAASVEAGGLNLNDTLFTGALQVLAAFLGVGFALRRTPQQTLLRLGLVPPTRRDLLIGAGLGLGAMFAVNLILAAWQLVTAPEQFAAQTQAAEEITQAINTVWFALVVSLTAAISEEIFIRGALQPVFGIVISSVFFALLHPQYFFSLPLLVIFCVSLMFGVIRQRYNTSTAIVAHFVYNFVPLLLVLAAGGAAASAQQAALTPTPVPLPDFVVRARFELASVGAFYTRFELTPSASEFSSVTLTVSQGDTSQTVEVPVAEIADIREGYTDFTYIWTPSPGSIPRLFEDLTFVWTFTRDGQSAAVEHTVMYADPRAAWALAGGENIRLAAPSEKFNVAAMGRLLNQTYRLMSANTGQTTRLSLVIFNDALPIVPCVSGANNRQVVLAQEGQVEVPCDAGVIAAVYSANDFSQVALGTGSASEVQTFIARQLLNTLYAPVWGQAVAIIPEWFKFGLAQYYLPVAKTGLMETARQTLRTGRPLPLSEMAAAPTDANRLAWQAQSYGMVLYISEQIGVPSVFALARELGTGATFDQAYQAAMQQPLSALIPSWSSWVYSEQAAKAYQYHPHLPITPTATLTFTRTPSDTPFPSWTPTITLTPSVTGELSPTPSLTFTPSHTFTPTFTPTLTVTPRPASAIVSPTPSVNPAAAEAPADNSRLYLGIAIISVGVIGLAAVLIASRPASTRK